MDNNLMFGIAIIFLLLAMVYVTFKKRNRNQEKDEKLESYKKTVGKIRGAISKQGNI